MPVPPGGRYHQTNGIVLPLDRSGGYYLFLVCNSSQVLYESSYANSTSMPVPLTFNLVLPAPSTNPVITNFVLLTWDCPTNQPGTNLFYRVRHTTNLTLPLAEWPVWTNVTDTNLGALIQVEPGHHFFSVTVSNAPDGGEEGGSPEVPLESKISLQTGE
jgi:hypothetical protein